MPVSVTCGSNHTAVITRRGDLIAWGMGTSGQTGHGRMACDVRLHATISVAWYVGSRNPDSACMHLFILVMCQRLHIAIWSSRETPLSMLCAWYGCCALFCATTVVFGSIDTSCTCRHPHPKRCTFGIATAACGLSHARVGDRTPWPSMSMAACGHVAATCAVNWASRTIAASST